MFWDDELSERKKIILKTIIDDYINTAQPVGSRTISKKHELGLSSATVRNEMADLEELGYLSQPHTSAGRIPSDKGYRFYVDRLMELTELTVDEITNIQGVMQSKIEEFNELIKRASYLMSSVTGYTSMAITPMMGGIILKTVQIVPLTSDKVLVVVVADKGIVKNCVVDINDNISPELWIKISNIFNENMKNKRISELNMPIINEIQRQSGVEKKILLPILEGISSCISKMNSYEIYLDGTTNILNYPEFYDLMKARELLELLNEKEVITAILNSAAKKHKINVTIGDENQIDKIKDCSLITTVYNLDDNTTGAIGILGPKRMEYSRVISSLRYIKRLLNSELLNLFDSMK